LTFAVCEMEDGKILKIIKEVSTLSELSKMDMCCGLFPAVFVSRDDVRRALTSYDDDCDDPDEPDVISKLTDAEMYDIASDLQDAYVEGAYWDDLACICEDLKSEDEDDEEDT